MQIPFSFSPKEISDYSAEIFVIMNDKIQWVFPVLGITESQSANIDYTFKTKARVKCEREIRFALPGVTEINEGEAFTYEINIFAKDLESSLKRCFSLSTMKNTLETSDDELIYMAKFLPYKPFKTQIEIAIHKPSGGRWRYKVNLEATEPDIDDVILITSP